jgi:hypothetical protein
MLGKIRILKTEDEVANASTIRFFPLGITEWLYSIKISSKSRNIFMYSLNLGCFE